MRKIEQKKTRKKNKEITAIKSYTLAAATPRNAGGVSKAGSDDVAEYTWLRKQLLAKT